MSESLTGKTAVVTGGARRIGRAIALALAEAGANVVITWRSSGDQAAQTLTQLRERCRHAAALHCELTDEASIRATAATVIEKFGGIDLLVNSAALYEAAPLEAISAAQWDRMFATNLRAPFLLSQAAYPSLREREGRIVNIGSLGGKIPFAGHAHYSASKAALHMLTQTMAKAWAPAVAVNCVAPGWIALPDAPAAEQARAAYFAEKTPMQRNGSAQEVAEAVLHFAICSHFVTGQILTVDGGLGLS